MEWTDGSHDRPHIVQRNPIRHVVRHMGTLCMRKSGLCLVASCMYQTRSRANKMAGATLSPIFIDPWASGSGYVKL